MTTVDKRADRLAKVAAQLAARVRDDDPECVGRWLASVVPDPDDRWALLFVLAAAVPTDKPFGQLVAWVDDDHELIEYRRAVLLGTHVDRSAA